MPASNLRVLGVDPGFGRMGWAVLEGNRNNQNIIEYGCLETSPQDNIEERLWNIYEFLLETSEKYKPDEAAIEELFYFKNAKTVMAVGQARGVIMLALTQRKIPVFHYTPLQIKNTVAGYGKADKHQVQNMVKSQLRLDKIPKPDDAADACATAMTHYFLKR